MNYRHAYHAGNFADVVKHIILTRVIAYLQRKEGGMAIVDTHAGIGRYDLSSTEAQKTGEWQGGIAKLMAALKDAPGQVGPLVDDYLRIVNAFNRDCEISTYPGSPRIAHAMRRGQDRVALMELHDADFKALHTEFAGAHGVKCYHLDGWTGLKAQLPPKERRGIVLIDPPFEKTGEFEQITLGLKQALKRFETGTYCIWYPLKKTSEVAAFKNSLSDVSVTHLIAELQISKPSRDGAAGLFGTGMAIINPPYVLADELRTLFAWLTPVLEQAPGSGSWLVEQIEP